MAHHGHLDMLFLRDLRYVCGFSFHPRALFQPCHVIRLFAGHSNVCVRVHVYGNTEQRWLGCMEHCRDVCSGSVWHNGHSGCCFCHAHVERAVADACAVRHFLHHLHSDKRPSQPTPAGRCEKNLKNFYYCPLKIF